jgi:hypothetical protein
VANLFIEFLEALAAEAVLGVLRPGVEEVIEDTITDTTPREEDISGAAALRRVIEGGKDTQDITGIGIDS